MGINLNSNGVFTSGVLIADTYQAPNGSSDSIQNLTKINGSTIDAALEVKSTLGGLQPPRMTTIQKNLILADNGMQVFDTTLGQLQAFILGAWVDIGASGGTAPADATYILQSPNALLPNAQALDVLFDGVMINTGGVVGTFGLLPGDFGGTGVNNGLSTITIGGNVTFAGAHTFTGNITGNTNVTFPTSGTLLTTIGITINGTANEITVSGASPVFTLSFPSVLHTANGSVLDDGVGNAQFIGTGGLTLPSGTLGQRLGGAGTIRLNTTSSVFESTVDGITWATIETSAIGVTSVAGTTNQITATPTTGNVVLSFPSVLHSAHNTLDDGNGNATFNGNGQNVLNINSPAASPVYLHCLVNNVSKAYYGWDPTFGMRLYDDVNNQFWLQQGGTTAGKVVSKNNTLDDGAGNLTILNGAVCRAQFFYGNASVVNISSGTNSGNVRLGNQFTGEIVSTNHNTLDDGTGIATFVNIIDSGLSISQPVLTNASKQLVSGVINLASSSFVSGILPSANGGTGVNNGSSTITIGGNLTISGAFTSTFVMTGNTNVTFPTSGTLATVGNVNQNPIDYTYFGGV